MGPNKLPQARISYNFSFFGPDKLRIGPDKLRVGPDKLRVGPDRLRKCKNSSGRISYDGKVFGFRAPLCSETRPSPIRAGPDKLKPDAVGSASGLQKGACGLQTDACGLQKSACGLQNSACVL